MAITPYKEVLMYEKIMELLNQGVMDWEGVRTILQVPDYGEDFMLFNEAWSRAMGDFIDEECYGDDVLYEDITPKPPLDEVDPRVGTKDGNRGFFKGLLVGMGF
jgi:hypothetical protein